MTLQCPDRVLTYLSMGPTGFGYYRWVAFKGISFLQYTYDAIYFGKTVSFLFVYFII